jgi:flavodoxin
LQDSTSSETAASEVQIEPEAEEDETTETETENTDSKTLIAFFSLPETEGDAKEDSTITVDGKILGNTEYVAGLIHEATGADVFRIEAEVPYTTDDHEALIEYAKEEQTNDARPAIADTIESFDDYDTIFIGYPIWWSELPMIMYTFLESYDFSGKDVYLFSTNGGSGLSGTVETVTEKLDSANVHDNAFQLNRNDMENAPDEVTSWLGELDLDL